MPAISKADQLYNKRIKPTRKQRSELSTYEDKRLKERSNYVCERCDQQRAINKAHLERRWKSKGKPTAEDFAHLCFNCHTWADNSLEGRKWLKSFGRGLLNEKQVRDSQ